jgi:hypothetical protein
MALCLINETKGKLKKKINPFCSNSLFPVLVKMLLPKGAAIAASL